MRFEFTYGLASGLGVCLWVMVEYLLGFHTTRLAIGEYSGYFSSLVPLACLWLMLRRQQTAFGPLFTLPRALKSGLLASFVGAVVVYIFFVAYNRFINPGWLDHALEWKVAQLRAAHVPEVDIRQEINFYRKTNTPVGLLLTTVGGTTLMGGIMTVLLTLWLTWRGEKAR